MAEMGGTMATELSTMKVFPFTMSQWIHHLNDSELEEKLGTKRQREIGVRKVFGATSLDILVIFLRGYLRPLSVAVLVGSPLAYLLMNLWLRNFAYRIEIGLGLMSLAWLCLTLIFTVSYHTIKSSIANPVTILRD